MSLSKTYADGKLFSDTFPTVPILYGDGKLISNYGVPSIVFVISNNVLFESVWKGAGSLSVDWGDGSAIEEFVLTSGGVDVDHAYVDGSEKTIVITGSLSGVMSFSGSYQNIQNDISEFNKLSSLESLALYNADVTGDLSSLSGMSLTYLNTSSTNVTGDLSSLSGMPLTYLSSANIDVTGDLSSLSGMQLTHMYLNNTGVTGDLSSLSGMSLTRLALNNTYVGCALTVPALSNCIINLYNCDWTSTEVDNFLIEAAAAGVSGCTINIAGTNDVRTSASDAALVLLINANNSVTVNET